MLVLQNESWRGVSQSDSKFHAGIVFKQNRAHDDRLYTRSPCVHTITVYTYTRPTHSHTRPRSPAFVALTRCTCMCRFSVKLFISVSKCSACSSTQNPPDKPPRGAARGGGARAVQRCVVSGAGGLSLSLGEDRCTRALDTRTVRGKNRKQETVYITKERCIHVARDRASGAPSQGVLRAQTEPLLPSLPEWLSVSLAIAARL